MVTLKFYKNISDKRVLKKNLSEIITLSDVLFLNDTSIIKPRFDLILSAETIAEINYCYCVETKRYYYIDNITPSSGGRFILNCSVDVLMSYAEQILNVPALIYTQTNNVNVLLANANLPQQANEQIQNIKFSQSDFRTYGTSHNFVMLSYRGGVTSGV